MKQEIEGFSDYYVLDDEIYRHKNGSKVTIQTRKGITCKVKNDEGKWREMGLAKLLALSENKLELPDDAIRVDRFPDYYIDPRGNVYSFSSRSPQGKVLQHTINGNGYVTVSIGGTTVDLHNLLANAFLCPGYVEKGLVCMHMDDDKTNFSLDNLQIGTYSQNNKDAYDRDLNPGNGLKN